MGLGRRFFDRRLTRITDNASTASVTLRAMTGTSLRRSYLRRSATPRAIFGVRDVRVRGVLRIGAGDYVRRRRAPSSRDRVGQPLLRRGEPAPTGAFRRSNASPRGSCRKLQFRSGGARVARDRTRADTRRIAESRHRSSQREPSFAVFIGSDRPRHTCRSSIDGSSGTLALAFAA